MHALTHRESDQDAGRIIQFQLPYFIALNILLIASASFEQLPVGNGLGWDGMIYAQITRDFFSYLNHPGIDGYYIQRIFPCGVVSIILKIAGLNYSDTNLIASFNVYNIVLINLSLLLWLRLMKQFLFSSSTVTISVILLFGNFCILKFAPYYPVLTDVTAFCLGTCLLFAYINNKRFLILTVAFIGAFSHPLLLYFSLVLFLFPKTGEKNAPKKILVFNYLPYAVCAAFAFAIIALYLKRPDLLNAHRSTSPVNKKLLFVSLACTLMYLFFITKSIVNSKLPQRVMSNVGLPRIAVCLLFLTIIIIIKKILSVQTNQQFGTINFVLNLLLQSINNPLQFLVAHIIFFGFGIMLIILYYKDCQNVAKQFGIGFLIFLFSALYLGVGSESRQFGFAFPFLLFPLVFVIEQKRLNRQLPFIAVTSFILSKIWLPLNMGNFLGKPLLFPDQYYFMSQGPWMNWTMYTIQLLVIVVLFILCFVFYPKKNDFSTKKGNLKPSLHAQT